jgi:hypothetical protein
VVRGGAEGGVMWKLKTMTVTNAFTTAVIERFNRRSVSVVPIPPTQPFR